MKPTYKGQRFVQFDLLEFLDRIAALIPIPRRHRRQYQVVFGSNFPLRKSVIAYENEPTLPPIYQAAEKTKRASMDWVQLINQIYEIDLLLCSKCGKQIKIIGFVIHKTEIDRILKRMGQCIELHEFDPMNHLHDWEFSQLISSSEEISIDGGTTKVLEWTRFSFF